MLNLIKALLLAGLTPPISARLNNGIRSEDEQRGSCWFSVPETQESKIPFDDVTVTSGDLRGASNGVYHTSDSQTRAYSHMGRNENSVKLAFRYRGPSDSERPLASGTVRRQIGMKLASADPCNLIYVMWEVEPTERISVFVKHNPNDHTSSECGVAGYRRLKSDDFVDELPSSAADGSDHRLAAQLQRAMAQQVIFTDRQREIAVTVGRLESFAHAFYQLHAALLMRNVRGPVRFWCRALAQVV